jgi:hypothetical protein
MKSEWQPFREPIRATLVRTGTIAIAGGALIAGFSAGLARWPLDTLLVLWPALGGHGVEVWFLNWLRPRLLMARGAQVTARIGVWFAGGIILAMGVGLTAMALGGFRPGRWLTRWPNPLLGGLAFIGIELAAHLALWMRGRPSFYDGRG